MDRVKAIEKAKKFATTVDGAIVGVGVMSFDRLDRPLVALSRLCWGAG